MKFILSKTAMVMDHAYYCLYCFFLRTPSHRSADEAAAMFIAIIFGYCSVVVTGAGTMITGINSDGAEKFAAIFVGIVAMFMLLRHYVWKGRGAQIVALYQKTISQRKAAFCGAVIFFGLLLLPLIVGAVLIVLF